MKHWRSCIVLCVSLVLALGFGAPAARSCTYSPYADVWANEFASYHLSFFPAALGYDRYLVPFMFRVNPDAIGDWDFSRRGFTDSVSLSDVNLQEWAKFLGGKAGREDIDSVVYQREVRDLERIHAQLAAGRAIQDQNKLLRYIGATRNYEILEYIIFAKRCEPYAVYYGDRWDFAEKIKEIRNPVAMKALIAEGLQKYKKAKAPFLKLRYAYQIVRLADYAGLSRECAQYFDTLVPGHDDGSVYYYEALRHKAGALLRLGRKAEATVAFSLVFDQCPPLIMAAYRDLKRLAPAEWRECLSLAGHPHRQATLWLLASLLDGDRLDMEPLVRMYELEPGSARLEFLLVRQINKIEKTLLSSDAFQPGAGLDPAKTAYIEDLLAFTEAAAPAKVRRPALWSLASGYLCLLLRRFDAAGSFLARAEGARPDALMRGEIGLLRTIARLAEAGTMDAGLEGPVLAGLQWLSSLAPEYNQPIMRRSLLILTAQKFFAAKDEIRGFCCLDNTGYKDLAFNLLIGAGRPDYLERMLVFATGGGRSPLDAYLARGLSLSPDDLRFALATMLLRQGRIAESLPVLAGISAAFWPAGDEWIYPIHTSFETNLYNAGTGLFRSPVEDLAPVNKYEFVKKIADLLETAQKHPGQADICYYRIANGFFHSPAWCYYQERPAAPFFVADRPNARYPFADKPPIPPREEEPGGSINRAGYPVRFLAWQFYDKALGLARDSELAAECCFLAAAAQTRFSHYAEFTAPGRGRDYYYRLLRAKYADTKYYQKVIRECADLRDYLGVR